jgi:hypothetical protein
MRDAKLQLTMNKVIFILTVTSLFFGCATTQVSDNIEIPDWEYEQLVAVPHSLVNEISSAENILERNIDGRIQEFGYIGKLYNRPIYLTDNYITELTDGKLKITEFPREGTRASVIMGICLEDFRRQTRARPGEYCSIYILTKEYGSNPNISIIVYGRFENNYFRGFVRRSI